MNYHVHFRKYYNCFWYVYINGKLNTTFLIEFSYVHKQFYIFQKNRIWSISEYETLIESKHALVDLLNERLLKRKLTKQKK